ncbi:recombination-associated protein RdgC [Pigmentiphaga litoralis]|uniref:Recombination-associated protein RdgC n=1 Tax=Pigmentiphaga litoralis TaxID=516702 RepID=A0A7Y9IU69_9BURK|nr:recombination-associated protein RdgC [Pigmentiphaga litoralis]NYE23249.1 recombination associated protein RdgC [Pigmentiphaga litoralis]NYE83137.1 recombination associated protein RdgC [Pigmentiphaga litoralis]
MWFKNLLIYRLPAPWAMTSEQLEELLAEQAFTSGSSQEMQTQGWAPPRENGGLVYGLGNNLLLNLRTEKKLLPASVVNQVAKAKAQEIEEQQGFKPGRKQMKEIKENVTETLMPRAFSIQRDTRAWIDTKNGWLVLDASSPTKADEFLQLLNKSVERMPMANLHVEMSPAAAMTDWLSRDEAPVNFTIDQDTELRSSGEGRATVRYVRQSIEADDVRRHIEAGKQVTRLAMTWTDRVSFVLTESLAIKRVAPLDVIKENTDSTGVNDDERFDSDFTMMTGEIGKLLADVVEALGGEKKD